MRHPPNRPFVHPPALKRELVDHFGKINHDVRFLGFMSTLLASPRHSRATTQRRNQLKLKNVFGRWGISNNRSIDEYV